MRNHREKKVFSILILLIHAVGAAGALTTTLKLAWGTVLKTGPLLAGIGLLCAFAAAFWTPCGRRRLFVRTGALLAAYGATLLACRRPFLNSLGWAMSEAVERINGRYGIRMIWSWDSGRDAAALPGQATLSVLAVLFPYVLLLGYGVMREHIAAAVLADAAWFVAACGMDSFPDYPWLILCVMGIGAQVVLTGYRDDARAGVCAAVLGCAVTAAVMIPVYFLLLPVMDEKYEQALEERIELNRRINEEWIPRVKEAFSSFGFERRVGVTGSLGRNGGTLFTSRDLYRVTLDAAPKSAVYLRGFVGADYAGDEWKAEKDSALTGYYRGMGWDLPEDGRSLVNLTYEAFDGGTPGLVRVEELAGAGRYSLYPYGAKLTEEYRVHWDGTADRRGRVGEFSYCAPSGRRAGRFTPGQAAEELRYRSYVYDSFCDYPAESLPELTAFLADADFGRGSLYESLTDVYVFLRLQAVYDLEAADPPGGEDFVEHFLFDSKRGYCAHFASAAVLMLRYLGVPARYVTGYSVSADAFSKDEEGMYTAVVTDMQAHAWAEVYLDGTGWIPMEMTPGAAAFTVDDSMAQLRLAGQLTDAFAHQSAAQEAWAAETTEEATEPVSAPERPKQEIDRQQEPPGSAQASQREEGAQPPRFEKIRRPPRTPFALSRTMTAAMCWIFSGGSAALLCLGARREIGKLWRRRFDRADNREKIFLLYRNLKRLLNFAGHDGRLRGEDEETRAFCSVLEKSSFDEKEPTAWEVCRAADFCGRLVREEYEGLSFWKKPLFRGMNLYPVEKARETEGWKYADH